MNSLPLASALIESAENLSMTVDLENPLPSALPSYPGIALADICLVRTDDDAAHAYAHLSMLKVISPTAHREAETAKAHRG